MYIMKKKWLESWDPITAPMPRITGRIKLTLINSDGSIAQEVPWFPNIIVHQCFKSYMPNTTGKSPFPTYCQLGSSTTTPTFTDVQCNTPTSGWHATTGNTSGYTQNGSAPYQWRQFTHRIPAGDGTGSVAEIAFSGDGTTGEAVAHALIVNGSGVPTPITKGSTQILDVTYEQRVFLPTTDSTGTINISGTNFDYIMRPCNLDIATYGGVNWYLPATKHVWWASGDYYGAYTGSLPSGGVYGDINTITGYLGSLTNDSEFYSNTVSFGDYEAYDYTYVGETQAGLDRWNNTIRTISLRAGYTWSYMLVQLDDTTNPGTGLVKTSDEVFRFQVKYGMSIHV